MDTYKLKQIHRLSKETGIHIDTAIVAITKDKKSIETLTDVQINLVLKYLMDALRNQKRPMQRKVIHLLCLYGMTTTDSKPDMTRIDRFIRNIGSRNPRAKGLYSLNHKELHDVLNQVDRMVSKEIYKNN